MSRHARPRILGRATARLPVLVPVAFGILAFAPAQPEHMSIRLGSQLEPGMHLVYASDGVQQPPWTVDSLQLGLSLMDGADCAVIHLRRRPTQAEPEENRLCVARDTLYRWDARDGGWSISRPVGPGMVWSVRRSNWDVVRYETGPTMYESISGRTVPVVLTTVTTMDSLGRPKRRLRERYALTLATATGGIFEMPDSTGEGSWQRSSTFELSDIRAP